MNKSIPCLLMMLTLFSWQDCGTSKPSSGPITWPDGPPGYFKSRWHQGGQPLNLAPANNFLCGLSAVSGRFAGGGEWVLINVDSNGNWVLNGASQQNGVWAEATCVAINAFLQPGGMQWSNGSWTLWFSSGISNTICTSPTTGVDPGETPDPSGGGTPDPLQPGSGEGGVPYYCPVYYWHNPTNWSTDSVCYLTGFGGFHLAGGEGTAAELAPWLYGQVNPNWVLQDQATDLGQTTFGGAACVRFMNIPQTQANSTSNAYPETYGPVYSTVGMPVVYSAGANFGTQPAPLANKNKAFCVLSDVSGGFFGSGESVAITDSDSNGGQMLVVKAQQNVNTAFANCIYYNQNNPPGPNALP